MSFQIWYNTLRYTKSELSNKFQISADVLCDLKLTLISIKNSIIFISQEGKLRIKFPIW